MTHAWHSGVLTASSWHGLEEIGVMRTADEMIAHGERSNAWPVSVGFEGVRTVGGLAIETGHRAVVASYESALSRVVGMVKGRYTATTPESWRALCHSAVAAGAKPTGCFALEGGSRVIATFEVCDSDGIKTNLLLADAFDGSMKLTVGTTSIRVVCANTLAMSLSSDGRDMAQLRHTSGLEARVNGLKAAITESIATGEKVRHAFQRAESIQLDKASFDRAFEMLFPTPKKDEETGAEPSKVAITRAQNAQAEAIKAGRNPVNRVGRQPGNLGTLWNAATFLVDRTPEGAARKIRGEADALNSMLFGSRAERIEEIQRVIEIVMADGSFKRTTVTEARSLGLSDAAIRDGLAVQARTATLDDLAALVDLN